MDSQTNKQTPEQEGKRPISIPQDIEARLDKLSRRFYNAQDDLDAVKEEYEKVFSELQDLVEELREEE